jgi:hypothetical protein
VNAHPLRPRQIPAKSAQPAEFQISIVFRAMNFQVDGEEPVTDFMNQRAFEYGPQA